MRHGSRFVVQRVAHDDETHVEQHHADADDESHGGLASLRGDAERDAHDRKGNGGEREAVALAQLRVGQRACLRRERRAIQAVLPRADLVPQRAGGLHARIHAHGVLLELREGELQARFVGADGARGMAGRAAAVLHAHSAHLELEIQRARTGDERALLGADVARGAVLDLHDVQVAQLRAVAFPGVDAVAGHFVQHAALLEERLRILRHHAVKEALHAVLRRRGEVHIHPEAQRAQRRGQHKNRQADAPHRRAAHAHGDELIVRRETAKDEQDGHHKGPGDRVNQRERDHQRHKLCHHGHRQLGVPHQLVELLEDIAQHHHAAEQPHADQRRHADLAGEVAVKDAGQHGWSKFQVQSSKFKVILCSRFASSAT